MGDLFKFDPFGIFTGGDAAADAAKSAAKTTAKYQTEALDYLKQKEAIPQKFRESALTGLGDIYGLGEAGAQEKFFSGLESSPIYSGIMSGQRAGEESILRNAAATGGLRSGNAQYNLADYNTRLKNDALLSAYNNQVSGLQGLAGLPSMAPQIANMTAGVGQTLGQGQVAAAQAQAQGQQNMFGNLMGLGQLGLMAFSDILLKDNIHKAGEENGINYYTWDWNEKAKELGMAGSAIGVLAQEIEQTRPDLVVIIAGYKAVNYGGLLL
jgi:hypothetical protein